MKRRKNESKDDKGILPSKTLSKSPIPKAKDKKNKRKSVYIKSSKHIYSLIIL